MADTYKPTTNELDLLELALRSETGNPWPLVGMRSRAGGGKHRMFERMKALGLFDDNNEITHLGRHVFLYYASRQLIDLGHRRYRRMIFYPGPVNDDTSRCFSCGQIDEPVFHFTHVCRAALNTHGFAEEPVVS